MVNASRGIYSGRGQFNQIRDAQTSKLETHSPDYYVVGLWGYCEGNQKAAAAYFNCSKPSITFSFDLSDIFSSTISHERLLDLGSDDKSSHSYCDKAKWSTLAFVAGFGTTLLAVIFGLGFFKKKDVDSFVLNGNWTGMAYGAVLTTCIVSINSSDRCIS
jgi:hypothetical protein